MVIVNRTTDKKRIEKLKPPILVYGRRKTGKTFFVKDFFGDAYYFFVRRNRSIYFENRNESITYKELIRIIDEFKEKTIIVDEFHRLPEEFLDWLHIKSPKNLVLVTSTLHLAKNLLEKSSPILGLFLEFRMDLIDERDILLNLKEKIRDYKRLIEFSTYLREPMLLKWFGISLTSMLKNLKLVIPSLVGEIFAEEEKELSTRYEGIIRALSSGKTTLSEITSTLYSNKLIPKQDVSSVKPYLNTLLEIGLVKRIPEYFGKRYYYFVSSPVVDLYYYLDEKYNFSERDLEEKYIIEKIPMHVEDFLRELLGKIFGMRVFLINKPNLEVDIALVGFQKLKIVGEVKWKKRVGRAEMKEIEEKLGKFKGCRKILIVPSEKALEKELKGIEVWDVERIMEELEVKKDKSMV
ncbi:ATP-binding protein [bacterium]|nr:ATP-binding protein [bacterium]